MFELRKRLDERRAAGKKSLITFVTAGDPEVGRLPEVLDALVMGGADVIELGIPFSDPIADGPVIQASSFRALERGTTPGQILDALATWPNPTQVPVVLMTYYNPILSIGEAEFARRAKAAGVAAVLITDIIPEEAVSWCEIARETGLDTVFLVSPTSTEGRIQRAVEASTGFVYVVSRTGVTGASSFDSSSLGQFVRRVRAKTSAPLAIGFGIKDSETAKAAAEQGDAVIVGSALVEVIHNCEKNLDLSKNIQSFLLSLDFLTLQ